MLKTNQCGQTGGLLATCRYWSDAWDKGPTRPVLTEAGIIQLPELSAILWLVWAMLFRTQGVTGGIQQWSSQAPPHSCSCCRSCVCWQGSWKLEWKLYFLFHSLTWQRRRKNWCTMLCSSLPPKVLVAHTGTEGRGQQTHGFYYIFLLFTMSAT